MFPKPTKFKFSRDSLLVSLIIGVVILVTNLILLPYQIPTSVDLTTTIGKKFILTIVAIPPALPAAMTAGIV